MPRRNNTPIHQPFRFISACERKQRYPNERLAQAAADYQMLLQPTLELSVYKCDQCGGWHLTRSVDKRHTVNK